jgi:hypothetical protein
VRFVFSFLHFRGLLKLRNCDTHARPPMASADRRHYVGVLASHASHASLASSWSDNDMVWLCGWGGQPLVPWEKVGLSSHSACVVAHVDYWLRKENEHAVGEWPSARGLARSPRMFYERHE